MIAVGLSAQDAKASRRAVDFHGTTFHKSDWMLTGQAADGAPTIFMVEQPPESVLAPHFHMTNQFQLFVAGHGRIGGHPLAAVTIHYAGAFTGYGPIVAGEDGIAYLTIRPGHEPGANFIATSGHLMRKGPKRGATATPVAVAGVADLRALPAPAVTVAIPLGEDGLGASVHALPPHAPLDPIRSTAAEGDFLIVLAGALDAENGISRRDLESLFIPSADPWPRLVTGPDGAQVVLLSTPPKDPRYR